PPTTLRILRPRPRRHHLAPRHLPRLPRPRLRHPPLRPRPRHHPRQLLLPDRVGLPPRPPLPHPPRAHPPRQARQRHGHLRQRGPLRAAKVRGRVCQVLRRQGAHDVGRHRGPAGRAAPVCRSRGRECCLFRVGRHVSPAVARGWQDEKGRRAAHLRREHLLRRGGGAAGGEGAV
ncbi:hypothetical protein E4U53_005254, partial [Claviceps sorghi]